MKRSLIPILSFVLLSTNSLHAGNGTTAVNFLLESRSARVEGMGGLNSVFSEGTDAISGNPAGLAMILRPELNLSYVSGQVLSRQGSSAYAHPLRFRKRVLAFGAEIVYYNAGNIDITPLNGTPRSLAAETGFVGAFSLAFKPMSYLSVGISPKLVRSTLVEQYTGTAFAADAGVLIFPLEPWWADRLVVGVTLQNLGSKIKYKSADNDLPASQSFGIAVRPWDHPEYGSILFGVQEEKPKGEKLRYRLGGEYSYGRNDLRALFIRAGARMQFEDEDYSIGVGFRERGFELNYSFNNAGELERIHRMTLVFHFGNYVSQLREDEYLMDPVKEGQKKEKEDLIPNQEGMDRYYLQEKEGKRQRDQKEDQEIDKMISPPERDQKEDQEINKMMNPPKNDKPSE